jgi:AraC family transcriptional regulator
VYSKTKNKPFSIYFPHREGFFLFSVKILVDKKIQGGEKMEIQVVTLQPKKVVGIGWTGPYSELHHIPKLFDELAGREQDIQKRKGTSYICPFHDRKTDFTYYVTVEVEAFDHVPEGMVALDLPAQTYASTTFHGHAKDVQEAYVTVFRWMEEQGYKKDYHALSLEIYHEEDEEINRSEDERKFDLYVPLIK